MVRRWGGPVLRAFLPLALGVMGVITALAWLKPAQAALPNNPNQNTLFWPISGSSQPDSALISSPFGPRWQASKLRYDYHPGIDIVAPLDTPVHVITDGVVTKVGWLSPDSGLTVKVSHPQDSYTSVYMHLDGTAVVEGQNVTQGQVIGLVGNSGTTEFTHLHFEIRVSGQMYPENTRNPLGYLPHPELSAPSLQVVAINSSPIYSPTITLYITATRQELDVNQVRVTVTDRATKVVLDDQLVDFNSRLHTGNDNLDQDGIRLTPTHFNTSTLEYGLTAFFYQLVGLDAITITTQVADLVGNATSVVVPVDDRTPPAQPGSFTAKKMPDGSLELHWIAPGDNGYHGQAAGYDFRYSNKPITDQNWDRASKLIDPPAPLPGGSSQSWTLSGHWDGLIYFAFRAFDPEGNLSGISNSAPASWQSILPLVSR